FGSDACKARAAKGYKRRNRDTSGVGYLQYRPGCVPVSAGAEARAPPRWPRLRAPARAREAPNDTYGSGPARAPSGPHERGPRDSRPTPDRAQSEIALRRYAPDS